MENLRVINLPKGTKPYSGFTGASSEEQQKLVLHGKYVVASSMAPGLFFLIHHMELIMSKFASAVQAFIADENGVTAIEYGLIAALVGVAIVVGVKALGSQLNTTFGDVVSKLQGA
jgi:pilus assembly protein Flp/PilA